MASIFTRIGEEADAARRKIERLTESIPGAASFPTASGGGGGVPASLLRDVAEIRLELRRMRTGNERPDPRMEELLRG